MKVYIELAFLENFLIDGVLMFLALHCARVRVSWWRLAISSSVGAIEAIVFPLFVLPLWAAYLVKFTGGAALGLIAAHGKKVRPYLITVAAFFLMTFALGGLLTAAYSFFWIEAEAGQGFLVERIPVGLMAGGLCCFFIFFFYGARRFYRYRHAVRNTLDCALVAGERKVEWRGYADSGNLLEFRGKPVCVTSPQAVFALFGRHPHAEGHIRVATVNGQKTSPVFCCDTLAIRTGGGTLERHGVLITVGDVSGDFQLILHTALLEA